MLKNDVIKKIILGIFFILICYFLYKIHSLLAPFIVSAILIYIFAPVVNYISNKKVFKKNLSRGFSVFVIYLVFFTLLTLALIIMVPMLYGEVVKIAGDLPTQITAFIQNSFPKLLADLQTKIDGYSVDINLQEEFDKTIGSILTSSIDYIKNIPEHLKTVISGFFATLTSFIVVFIFTAFVLIDLPKLKENIFNLIPKSFHKGLIELGNSVNKDLNGTIRGQLIICLVNGILTTLGLIVLQIKYAVTIGLIAGVLSFIPIFGTIFSTIPAVLIAITQGWFTAVQVVVLIMVIHLIEANLLNPKIMGTSVELHPAIIIFAIFIGEHLFGVAGLLLGVPVVAIVRSILVYFYKAYFIEKEKIVTSNTEAIE